MQPNLLDVQPSFDGPDLEPADTTRLSRQLDRVKAYMLQAGWQTLREIEDATGYPQASISARLRDLKKLRFGGYHVARQRRSQGTWEYLVTR